MLSLSALGRPSGAPFPWGLAPLAKLDVVGGPLGHASGFRFGSPLVICERLVFRTTSVASPAAALAQTSAT